MQMMMTNLFIYETPVFIFLIKKELEHMDYPLSNYEVTSDQAQLHGNS